MVKSLLAQPLTQNNLHLNEQDMCLVTKDSRDDSLKRFSLKVRIACFGLLEKPWSFFECLNPGALTNLTPSLSEQGRTDSSKSLPSKHAQVSSITVEVCSELPITSGHHQLDEHEFNKQAPRVADGQGSLACCSPWGRQESDMTEQLS